MYEDYAKMGTKPIKIYYERSTCMLSWFLR